MILKNLPKGAQIFLRVALLILLVGGVYWLGEKNKAPDLPDLREHQGLLELKQWSMPNGVRVYFAPRPGLPVVDARLTFRAGSLYEGTQPGLAYLTRAVLTNGTEELSAEAFGEKLDNLGVEWKEDTDKDVSWVSFRVPKDKSTLQQVTALLSELLKAPAFRESDVEIEREKMLSALKIMEQDPDSTAMQIMAAKIYGDHPYGHPVLGFPENVKKHTKADLMQFYQQHYVARNAVLSIVGDVTLRQAYDIALALTGKLPEGSLQNPPQGPVAQEGETVQHPFPSMQTTVIYGGLGISRVDPDRYALIIGNHILGAYPFNNRIFKIVREQHGLAYSPRSNVELLMQPGLFTLKAGTRNAEAGDTLNHFKTILTDFIKNGPTVEELEDAKRNLLGALPLSIATNADALELVDTIATYQLPLDTLEQFEATIHKITVDEVKQVFQAHVVPEKLWVVTVGGQ